MRSENGSSLVALLATLAVIGALAAVLVHPSSGAPAGAPAPQDAVGAARGAVQAIDAAQGRTATTP